jgi:hypothetical protein
MQFSSPFGLAAWAVLAGVPVGIITLYFLKLRRRPVQVASTLLWRRSLEDLHVNSLFQRLRRNLLLFLQLAAAFLVMFALAGPRLKGTVGQGARYVLAIDNSASMNATDVSPTRLARAKEEAKKIVDGMQGEDLAMVIAFSDRARVVSTYTSNRSLTKKRIDDIEPTEATTSLRDALQVAAGLANPNKVGDVPEGVETSSIVSPKLFIYTDGGFPDVEGFSLGNIEPEVVVIGKAAPVVDKTPEEGKAPPPPPSNNLAVLALQTRRNEERPDVYQVFGRIHNYRVEDFDGEAQLFIRDPAKPLSEGNLRDAVAVHIAGQSDSAFKFDLPDTGATELEVRLKVEDDLPLDNRAFTLIGNPRKAQVLLVTLGNRYLTDALKTPLADARADVVTTTPETAKGEAIAREIAAGKYDLVIYDQVRPEKPPEANALYFGAFPPGAAFEKTREVEGPTILDVNASHPLMQFIRDLSVVLVNKASVIDEMPTTATNLIESNAGPLAFVVPREGFSDTVVTFALQDGAGVNTDWVRKFSFPLFIYNALQVVGNARESAGEDVHAPGQSVPLRPETLKDSIRVATPTGKAEDLKRGPQGGFVYNDADATGLYHVSWTPGGSQTFAVNQFDARESDLAPRGLVPPGTSPDQADKYKIKIGYNTVNASKNSTIAPRDWWKPIALAALAVVLFEWYIYNRRVYI